MKYEPIDPPRTFPVGAGGKVIIKDCGRIRLEHDEQITFTTESGAEYDLARKDWGFYATPSLNGRLESFGLRAVLVKSRVTGQFFIFLVENGKEDLFRKYCDIEQQFVIAWLDSDKALEKLENRMHTS
jgi:hypothetical protein